jgi:FdhD protein
MNGLLTGSSRIQKISLNGTEVVDDVLAVEEPLEILLRFGAKGAPTEKNISVTMRTPGHDRELALGFLYSEGIIQGMSAVAEVKHDESHKRAVVVLKDGEVPELQHAERKFFATSSCGVCGKSSVDAIHTLQPRNNDGDDVQIKADVFHALENTLRRQQAAFALTGGLHASALFSRDGSLMLVREDVGRHNALDKVIGAALVDGQLPLVNTILLLSGRVSFELIQKACMAGIPVVAAVGAPSTLAVELAREHNVTLIGFLRQTGFNIYSGSQRISTR